METTAVNTTDLKMKVSAINPATVSLEDFQLAIQKNGLAENTILVGIINALNVMTPMYSVNSVTVLEQSTELVPLTQWFNYDSFTRPVLFDLAALGCILHAIEHCSEKIFFILNFKNGDQYVKLLIGKKNGQIFIPNLVSILSELPEVEYYFWIGNGDYYSYNS